MTWGTPIEIERRRRIHVAAWAYAYEVESDPVVDDETFDREALLIKPEIGTGNDELDAFFRAEFAPTRAHGCTITRISPACAACCS